MRLKFSGVKLTLWARSSKRKAQIAACRVNFKFYTAAGRFRSVFAVAAAVQDAVKPCMYAAKRTIKFSRITASCICRDRRPMCRK